MSILKNGISFDQLWMGSAGLNATYQIGIIVLGLFFSFVLYQKLATVIDNYRYPPPGSLIDIGGYRLHIHSIGQGDITVICDAGLSGTSFKI